jgi:hypothetical protein
MRLTEQEQQEIVRFIEADKPLPEKYRFLPFEDKREVELVWNGKTNEVCNIVLPFQVIEQVDEQRAERSNAKQEHNRVPRPVGKVEQPDFKPIEFERFRSEAGSNYFVLSLKDGLNPRKGQIMALHKDFLQSPHAILDPGIRWFPADESLRESSMEKLMPPLVPMLRRKVKEFRDSGYAGAADTSRSLLNWWFKTPHLLPKADGTYFGI